MKSADTKKIKLRVVFMGTSELSEVVFKSLLENEYNIVAAFTKPDKKIGRKQEVSVPNVKKLAQEHKIPVFQPTKFNSETTQNLKELKPDLVIVAAYGKIIPKDALEIPGFGFINVHVSILPKYRGPSPVQNALIAGERETGVTIMLMDQGIDTGDILTQKKISIEPDDNTEILMKKLAKLGSDLLIETVPSWIEGKIETKHQDHSQATLCQLIEREDGRIFWTETAESIHNKFRALTPWPGIYTYWKTESKIVRLKLLSIKLQKINPVEKYQEGQIFELGNDIGVQTGAGVIILKEIQKEGRNAMSAKDFVNGHKNFIGSILQ